MSARKPKDTAAAIAERIVQRHLRDMGGAESGWVYDEPYRRLARSIARWIRTAGGGGR